MLTTEKIKKIKELNRDLNLNYKQVLKEAQKLIGKKISYPTFLKFLENEGEPTRRQRSERARKLCVKCKYEHNFCICEGVAHG